MTAEEKEGNAALRGVTQRNSVLYYDCGRSRLFESEWTSFYGSRERVYDFSFFTCKRAAKFWCELNGYEFVDNSIERIPDSLHRLILAARKAGSPPLNNLMSFRPWELNGYAETDAHTFRNGLRWYQSKIEADTEWAEFVERCKARERGEVVERPD